MCGRFDTSHLSWAQIHAGLLTYSTVSTPPLNLEANDDVRPTAPVWSVTSAYSPDRLPIAPIVPFGRSSGET